MIDQAVEIQPTVNGGNIKQPARPLPTWMRIVSAIIPGISMPLVISKVIEEYNHHVEHTFQQTTATGYATATPSTLPLLISVAFAVLTIALSILLLGITFNKRTGVTAGGLLFTSPVVAAVFTIILSAFAEQAAVPNRVSGAEWLSNTYQINNVNLPYQIEKFYATSNTGNKYHFQYTETEQGYKITLLSD